MLKEQITREDVEQWNAEIERPKIRIPSMEGFQIFTVQNNARCKFAPYDPELIDRILPQTIKKQLSS